MASDPKPESGSDALALRPIARVQSPYHERFAVPRQAGLAIDVPSTVCCDAAFVTRESLRGLAAASHIWLLWWFHENTLGPQRSTVRPPRLGGNERLGCFATRSPYRPNPIGLSAVKLLSIDYDQLELAIAGADLVDGTPILDIKPYVPYADALPEATCAWAASAPPAVSVELTPELRARLERSARGQALIEILRDSLRWDPRPAYRAHSPVPDERVYGVRLADHEIKFCRTEAVLLVLDATPIVGA